MATKVKKVKLTPPDINRCQVERQHGSFMSFGMPTMIRCDNQPCSIIIEKQPSDRDGVCGSMSVCSSCLEIAKKKFGPDYFIITPIKDSKKSKN